jgi:hypothetical protein
MGVVLVARPTLSPRTREGWGNLILINGEGGPAPEKKWGTSRLSPD